MQVYSGNHCTTHFLIETNFGREISRSSGVTFAESVDSRPSGHRLVTYYPTSSKALATLPPELFLRTKMSHLHTDKWLCVEDRQSRV